MATKRIKSQPPVIRTRAEMQSIVGEIVDDQLSLNAAKVEMDQRIQAIKDEYSTQIDALGERIDVRTLAVHQWAEANPDEFGKAKSIDLLRARIGFRTGTPKLKTLRGWTWDRILTALQTLAPHFVRNTPSVDKEALLAKRQEWQAADYKRLGMEVVQDEIFFIEPHLEPIDQGQKVVGI